MNFKGRSEGGNRTPREPVGSVPVSSTKWRSPQPVINQRYPGQLIGQSIFTGLIAETTVAFPASSSTQVFAFKRKSSFALPIVSTDLTFYRVSQSFTGFLRVLPGFTEVYQVFLGFTGFYRLSQSLTGFYRVLPSFTGFYRVLLGFSGFSSVLTRTFCCAGTATSAKSGVVHVARHHRSASSLAGVSASGEALATAGSVHNFTGFFFSQTEPTFCVHARF